MQDGLSTLLKHVGFLMRLLKLYDAQNCFINELETSVFNYQEQQNCHILKNRNQFPYQCNVNDQLLNLFLDYMNMDRSHFLDLNPFMTEAAIM